MEVTNQPDLKPLQIMTDFYQKETTATKTQGILLERRLNKKERYNLYKGV